MNSFKLIKHAIICSHPQQSCQNPIEASPQARAQAQIFPKWGFFPIKTFEAPRKKIILLSSVKRIKLNNAKKVAKFFSPSSTAAIFFQQTTIFPPRGKKLPIQQMN